jgi:hypothetical protein
MKRLLLLGALTLTIVGSYAQETKTTAWLLNGNVNNSVSNFLGTTDSKPIIFKTDNVERMRLSNLSSSLGIGLSDPNATLHLHYSYSRAPGDSIENSLSPVFPSILRFSTGTTGSGVLNGFSIEYDHTFRNIYFKQKEQADISFQGPTGSGLTISPDGNNAIHNNLTVGGAFSAYTAEIYSSLKAQTATVTANTYLNGNVGIGTTTLTKKFNVQGDSYFNGKVGIGTTTPQYQLDVNGSANFNNIYVNNIYIPGTEMKIRAVSGLVSIIEDDPEDDLDDSPKSDIEGDLGDDLGNIAPPVVIDVVTFKSNGNVGIGTTTNPQAKLDVAGSFRAQSATVNGLLTAKELTINHTAPADWHYAAYVRVNRDLTKALVINNTTTNKDVFAVYGNGVLCTRKIFAEKIEVTMNAMEGNWYDHVFYSDYNLRPLSELEQFIKENQHLPEIPSAKEVTENGLDIGDMQGRLLLKIEELTLYILDLQKQIDELKKQ